MSEPDSIDAVDGDEQISDNIVSDDNVTSDSELGEPSGDHIYKNHSLRLLSFANWPNANITKELLALAGFYYLDGVRGETGDKVRCAWCGGEFNNWQANHCPASEHKRKYPKCSFVKDMVKRKKKSIPQFYNENLLASGNNAELGISLHRPPAQSNYATLKSRLDTFESWSPSHSHKPEDLANAGFYYTGPNDQVRCFHCGVGLCKWEPTDDPWVEHAKYLPECGFLNLVKGKEFIDSCIKHNASNMRVENNAVETPAPVRQIRNPTDADVEACMESRTVMLALQCGIQPDRIRAATRKRLQQIGIPYISPISLMYDAFEEQINETPFSVPESIPPIESTSSSSTQYPVDVAAIEQLTRLVINSALMPETIDPLLTSIQNTNSNNTESESVESDNEMNDTITNESNANIEDDQKISVNKTDDELLNNISGDNEASCDTTFKKELSLQEENKQLRDARTCKICMDAEVGMVFLPCGHLVSCVMCATGLSQCPICRGSVKGFVRTYLS